jgi:hypothetical protein
MRDFLLVLFALMLRPVSWLLPGNMQIPFILWVIAFIVSLATLLWLLRRAIRLIRGR